MNPRLTTFEIETDPVPKVIKYYGNKVEKEQVCLTLEDAEILRSHWVNEFWNFRLN